jgi:hypothetical protein
MKINEYRKLQEILSYLMIFSYLIKLRLSRGATIIGQLFKYEIAHKIAKHHIN